MGGIFTRLIVTHAYSFATRGSSPAPRPAFTTTGMLPYRCSTAASHGFGKRLMPDHFRRGGARSVSYYALFKGMAASKPTS